VVEQVAPRPHIAEVIEASTAEFIAECYDLTGAPALGTLLRTNDAPSRSTPSPATCAPAASIPGAVQ
jgi:hypothetical protein